MKSSDVLSVSGIVVGVMGFVVLCLGALGKDPVIMTIGFLLVLTMLVSRNIVAQAREKESQPPKEPKKDDDPLGIKEEYERRKRR